VPIQPTITRGKGHDISYICCMCSVHCT